MTAEVLAQVEGRVGRIRLNRPKALHSLTHAMCAAMNAALIAWERDAGIDLVVIDHAEGRGFCAGGDVVMMAESGKGDGSAARAFFHEEYRLNHLLFTYAKPIVAFMDGVTMGGGVGLAQPCRYRVATERLRYAMPETAIGLFPDVGGGRYLSRLPGRLGQYLILTSAHLDAGDCHALGIATHFVPSDAVEALKARLAARPDEAATILDAAAMAAPPAPVLERRAEIDRLFASDRLEAILAALEQDGSDWAREQAAIIATKSPISCKISLRLLAEAAGIEDFADEMRLEYAIGARTVMLSDFAEGVRAALVDKTRDPKWRPATPEAVSESSVDAVFAPLPAGQEWTPIPRSRA